MITDWPFSTGTMVLSFPILFGALMLLVHGTVQFVPRTIREYQVSYRPIRTHVADVVLIFRLLFSRKVVDQPAPAPVPRPASKPARQVMGEFVTRTERDTELSVAAR